MARGNDVACREAGDTKSTLIAASWPFYTLLPMAWGTAFCGHSGRNSIEEHTTPYTHQGKC